MKMMYTEDFYAWTQQQAELLRSGRLQELDIEHLLEEVESMGKAEKRELKSRLKVLLMHLLKWCYQPALQSRSWTLTIIEQRKELEQHLKDNPSLKHQLEQNLYDAYDLALIAAERETGLPRKTFPKECPWSREQVLDMDFWPED